MTKIREGYKETEIGVIPEDWEIDSLNNLCTKIFVGIATSTTDYFTESGIPLIRNQNIKEGKLDSSDMKYITEEFAKANKSKTLKKGDILTVRTGYPGISCVVPEEFEGTQTFTTLISRPKADRVDSYYLSYFINSGTGKKILESLKAGGAQQNLNVKSFETLNVVIPTIEEQQRIAEILSKTDSHIEKLDKTIEDFQLLKKGMMKKLLTEGIGHTEFKETEIGMIPKEWEATKLKDLSQIKRGASPRPINDKKWFSEESNVGWIRISDVTSSKKYLSKTEQYLSLEGIKKSRYVKKGDLIMSICASIGVPIILNMDACIHDGFVVYSDLDERKLEKEYLYYFIEKMQSIFKGKGQTGTQANINTDLVGNTVIPLPPYQEQQKIVEILSTIDIQINKLQNQKEAFTQLKKSLMEKLLTGKIRVELRSI